MNIRLTMLVVLQLVLYGCGEVRAGSHPASAEEAAACRAQRFLEANGYLERPAISDHTKLSLELWDGVQYKKNGQFDWGALLAARHNRYSGRLYGVMYSQGVYDVAYKLDGGKYSCVSVDDSAQPRVFLHEATCDLDETVKRVSEKSLSCSPEN